MSKAVVPAAKEIQESRKKMWAAIPARIAKEINEAHQYAKDHAGTAIDWAVKCGQLLQRQKEALEHGEFMPWVEAHCDFTHRTAQRYMQVASNPTQRVAFESIRQALGYDKKPEPKSTNTPKGAVPVVKAPAAPEATGETATEQPAAPASPPPAPEVASPQEGGWTAADEAQYFAQEEADARERIEAAMAADDRLAEAFAQIKKQAHEIAVLKQSRDHYMRQANDAVRLLKIEQRKVAKLERSKAA